MRTFTYKVPSGIRQATSDFGQNSVFVAGGTTPLPVLRRAGPPSSNDGITFSGRNKTPVLPIAIRGLRMLVLAY
jgi:hypothetical protein